MEPILRPSVVVEGLTWSNFMHKEAGHIVGTAVEARAGLSRSTDDGCADCEYEPDDRTLCRDLHWFFRALNRHPQDPSVMTSHGARC